MKYYIVWGNYYSCGLYDECEVASKAESKFEKFFCNELEERGISRTEISENSISAFINGYWIHYDKNASFTIFKDEEATDRVVCNLIRRWGN